MANVFYQDEGGLLINGDAVTGLELIDSDSVDFCFTSPPYWALRKYQGGDGEELGQETNALDFVSNLADIFDSVKRVLKPEGSLWVVINDTWFSTRKGTGGKGYLQDGNKGSWFSPKKFESPVKPKSLVNVPHRLAIEMTDNRDWLHRMTVCWHKNNVMPTSAKDRFTRDFEYILVFTKNSDYFYKQLLEPYKELMNRWGGEKLKADGESDWDVGTGQSTYRERDMRPNKDGRNMRSVWDLDYEENPIWTINNQSHQGLKHYATYPDELVRRGIQFACPEDGVVLDPFMGSGTTAKIALEMGRRWIGTEINKEYCDTIIERVYGTVKESA